MVTQSPSSLDVVDTLTRVVARMCRALSDAGQPAEAGRLSAQGWVALRHDYQDQAARLNGAMHYAARREQEQEHRERDETMAEEILDVRTEEPRRRHELIFETFGSKQPGETYVLVNDHDPKPLRYQFEAENAGQFSWEYLEQGPEVWRVRIGRIA